MKNYISLNGHKIELTVEQAEKIKQSLETPNKRLSAVNVGSTFKIGKYEFVVLEQSGDTTAVILKDLLAERVQFGNSNNFRNSKPDEICRGFAEKLAKEIGEDNLVLHTVDLTSDDGLKDYGKIVRQVSLLTANLYRRYVEVLDEHKPDEYWWLATPHSTNAHGNITWVKCVSPSGYLDGIDYYLGGSGVRPFCILKSHIFVSD